MSNPLRYLGDNPALIAYAEDTGAGRALMAAARAKREDLRMMVEDSAGHGLSSERIRDVLGQIRAINWLLGLPAEAAKILADLPEGE